MSSIEMSEITQVQRINRFVLFWPNLL